MVKHELLITEDQDGLRADVALAQHPEINTRAQANKLINQGQVQLYLPKLPSSKILNKPSQILKAGSILRFELEVSSSNTSLTTDAHTSLDILYQDEHVIVINKPAGLVVHPGAGQSSQTLVNALIHWFPDLVNEFNDHRPGIVHRLDKNTSGLLVVAKNRLAREHLIGQFKTRTIHRRYQAVVFGAPLQESGLIKSYISRHPSKRTQFISVPINDHNEPSGKLAITHFKTLARYQSHHSLIGLRLETGRTHQIRVHMTALGHSLFGDQTYRFRRQKSSDAEKLWLETVGERVALHAMELGFHHPISQKWLCFCADWPINTRSFFERYNWTHLAKCSS